MFKRILSALAIASVVGFASAPVALADDCFDRCYQNCMKFGNGDTFCTWTCSAEVCHASTLNGVDLSSL
jgi:hypothetical protein